MRILLLADIHANWPALQALNALDEPHDLCFVLGDLVDYGLDPVPCIEWVQEHSHYTIRGNHDHAVAQRATSNGSSGYKYLTGVTRPLTWERLNSAYLRYLGGLPVRAMLTLENTHFLLVHATPRDPLDEYAPCDPEVWARRLERVQADVICVGHTHQPYVLPVGDKLVINPGSVGQPRDGDPRACYAVWDDGQVELKRVSYRIEETVETVASSKLPDLAKQMLIEVFRTGTLGRTDGSANHEPPVPAAATPREASGRTADREASGQPATRPKEEPSVAAVQSKRDVERESPQPTPSVGESQPDVTIELEQKTPPPPEHLPSEWPGKPAPSSAAPADMSETLPGPFDFRFDYSELNPEPKDPENDKGAKR